MILLTIGCIQKQIQPLFWVKEKRIHFSLVDLRYYFYRRLVFNKLLLVFISCNFTLLLSKVSVACLTFHIPIFFASNAKFSLKNAAEKKRGGGDTQRG
jgi:hypothetical protein